MTADMGKYCKAYLLKDFRAFSGWTELAENARVERTDREKMVSGSLAPTYKINY